MKKKLFVVLLAALALSLLATACATENDSQSAGKETADCKIEYMLENAEGEFVADAKLAEKKSGNVGDVITAEKKTIEHYVFDESKQNAESGTLTKDGLTLRLYYRLQTYTVSFIYENKAYGEAQTVKYGAKAVKPEDPATEAGYKFGGWKDGDEIYDFNAVVSADVDLFGEKAPLDNVKYTVAYFFENKDGTFTEDAAKREEKAGTTTQTVTTYKKVFDNYSFDETNENNVLSGVIKGDGSLVLALYFKRNIVLSVDKTELDIEIASGEKANIIITATSAGEDVSAEAVCTFSEDGIATYENGAFAGVKGGVVTATFAYKDKTASVTINVWTRYIKAASDFDEMDRIRDGRYKMTADIDRLDFAKNMPVDNVPSGEARHNFLVYEFSGYFDGCGHTIRNAKAFALRGANDAIYDVALFRTMNAGSVVKNLNIELSEAYPLAHGGAVSAFMKGTLDNVNVTVGVLHAAMDSAKNATFGYSWAQSAGVLVGFNNGGSVKNCTAVIKALDESLMTFTALKNQYKAKMLTVYGQAQNGGSYEKNRAYYFADKAVENYPETLVETVNYFRVFAPVTVGIDKTVDVTELLKADDVCSYAFKLVKDETVLVLEDKTVKGLAAGVTEIILSVNNADGTPLTIGGEALEIAVEAQAVAKIAAPEASFNASALTLSWKAVERAASYEVSVAKDGGQAVTAQTENLTFDLSQYSVGGGKLAVTVTGKESDGTAGLSASLKISLIATKEQFLAFRSAPDPIGALVADIDLDGRQFNGDTNDRCQDFNGQFDGKNHTISNFSVGNGGWLGGLLFHEANGSISNLNIEVNTYKASNQCYILCWKLGAVAIDNVNIGINKLIANAGGQPSGIYATYIDSGKNPTVKNCSAVYALDTSVGTKGVFVFGDKQATGNYANENNFVLVLEDKECDYAVEYDIAFSKAVINAETMAVGATKNLAVLPEGAVYSVEGTALTLAEGVLTAAEAGSAALKVTVTKGAFTFAIVYAITVTAA